MHRSNDINQSIFGKLVAQVVVNDQGFDMWGIYNWRCWPAPLIDNNDIFWILRLHRRSLFVVVNGGSLLDQMDIKQSRRESKSDESAVDDHPCIQPICIFIWNNERSTVSRRTSKRLDHCLVNNEQATSNIPFFQKSSR